MERIEQIVVALGSPEGDASLLHYAALLVRLTGAVEVRVVHVAEAAAPAAALRERMRRHVAATVGETAATVECDVLHGALTDRLLEYVTEFQADLVLIGSKKHKLGARLAMVAPCSVGVVPDGWPARLSHLLVAVDFSAGAADTLDWATRIASGDPAIRCTALHVMTPESTEIFAGGESEEAHTLTMRRTIAASDHHGVDVASRLATVERGADVGRRHRFSPAAAIQGTDIAQTILAQAQAAGADAVAISTRGRSRSAAILLGSVTEKVIERATLPVLVWKHGGNLGLTSILLGRAGRPVELSVN
ncbi:MAG: universal stress protein [Vicinamibacterales bacterium]